MACFPSNGMDLSANDLFIRMVRGFVIASAPSFRSRAGRYVLHTCRFVGLYLLQFTQDKLLFDFSQFESMVAECG